MMKIKHRNPIAQALILRRRAKGGAGAHHSDAKKINVAKGRSRKRKHKSRLDW